MSKAIAGIAMIGGAVAMGAGLFFDPMLAFSPLYDKAMLGLAFAGISAEVSAISDALTENRGQQIMTRQSAAYRTIVYGTRLVPGVLVYQSTTGSHNDQFNMVIVLAGHPCEGIINLYLDGRKVFWDTSSSGNTTENGYNFGGQANSTTYIGPDGAHYNFGGLVYCEARYGNQTLGDVITGLTANDPNWATNSNGSPSLVGCTYVYLKVEYDQSMFPTQPQISFTVAGKNTIYDPRTETTGFSQNWALCVADILMDDDFGAGATIAQVNQDQLIAAANVCDEQVSLAAGSTEYRYTCNWTGDTSLATGDILARIMDAAAGRLSYVGGQYFIWPAYWQGPSFTFDDSSIVNNFSWSSNRSPRDLFNRVKGTYIAPWYPYAVAGNLFDTNGWYDGTIANVFNLAWQPTDYPYYAEDTLHGYTSDQWLAQDGGRILYKDLNQSACISVATAQRIAKITLLRNRFQGSGRADMMLDAYQMQPTDVMNFNFDTFGWTDEVLEVTNVGFTVNDQEPDSQNAPAISVSVAFQATDPSIYEWDTTEELSIYDIPIVNINGPQIVAPPTSVTLDSSAATAVTGADGVVTPRVLVTWDSPQDIHVTSIEIQYQATGASSWIESQIVNVNNYQAFVTGVVAGQEYNFRVRSLRANGAASVWVEIDNYTVGLILSVGSYSGVTVAVNGTLTAIAYSDGTAEIDVQSPFTATVFGSTVTFTASPTALTGLTQGALYYVYFVSTTLTAGTITPVATLTQSDFLDKANYYLIGSITTPNYAPKYQPTTYNDIGSKSTANPPSAYDGNTGTYATVNGQWNTVGVGGGTTNEQFIGDCVWSGFTSYVTSSSTTLSVTVTPNVASGNTAGTTCSMVVNAHVGGTVTGIGSFTASGSQSTLTLTIASGTNLSTVSVEASATCNPPGGSSTGGGYCSIEISEIWIS